MQMYKLIMIAVLMLLLLGVIKRPKRMKLKNLRKITAEDIFLSRIDKVICRGKYIKQQKEKYISKLQVVNVKSYEYNNKLIIKFLTVSTVISLLLFVVLSRIITMWYAVVIITLVFLYIMIFFGTSFIERKINVMHAQFPEALQCFMDEYIIHKNIKLAINGSYNKMPKAIGEAFEMLARELSGEKNYEVSIKKFANELSYVWGHSFAEILIISYEGAGDITEELMMLNKLVSEEITAEEEEKSSRFGNKMTFIIIYAFALTGIIINLITNNLAKHLYFYTNTGNSLIAVWLVVLIAGVTVISLSERGR